MKTWIPWAEIKAEWEKEPGYAERMEAASRWFDEEVAKYGTIANPKPTPRTRSIFSRSRARQRLRRPATVQAIKAVEA